MINVIKPLLFVLTIAYFMVDAVFMSVARPLAHWLAERPLLNYLRVWIVSLRPYPTLALFAVPFIVLEPLKFAAAYLIGTGSFLAGTTVLAVGEILKLVLVERLFNLNRDKLLSIPIFSWCYEQWRWTIDAVQATEIFQKARGVMTFTLSVIRYALRNGVSLSAQHANKIKGGKARNVHQPQAFESALRAIPVHTTRPSRHR